MKMVAMVFMTLPDTPVTNIHGTYLAPYYSATSAQSLTVRLSHLVNAAAEAPAGDENAAQVIRNVEEWADGMYQTEKELLLKAIERRSHFTFDVVFFSVK